MDELNKLKAEREVDRKSLQEQMQAKERLVDLKKAELGLKGYCERVGERIKEATLESWRDVLDMLAVKITIKSLDDIEIEGVIPLETTPPQANGSSPDLLTIGQTSAC